MRVFIILSWFLLSRLMALAQYDVDNRFIAIGYELKIDINVPIGYYAKYIVNDKPSFCLKYSPIDPVSSSSSVYITNSPSSSNAVSLTQGYSGYSFKPGFVLSKDVAAHHVIYTCLYFDYARVNNQLIVQHNDPLYGQTNKYYYENYVSLSGEIECFAGWRFLHGHACLGTSLMVGYLNREKFLFTGVLANNPSVNTYYFPDRGFGIYPLFINLAISGTISF